MIFVIIPLLGLLWVSAWVALHARAQGLALREIPASVFDGSVAGVPVQIRHVTDGQHERTLFEVGDTRAIDFELALATDPSAQRSIEIGDALFDQTFKVHGAEVEIFAALNVEIRKRLLALADVRISDGKLKVTTIRDRSVDSRMMMTNDLIELVRKLSAEPSKLGARLLATVEKEPDPLVKDRALRVLLATVGDESIVARAAELALYAQAPETRLLGACIAGDRGHSVLEALVCGRGMPDAVRVHALAKLPRGHIADRTLLALREIADLRLRVAIVSRLVSEDALLIALDDPFEEAQTAAARGLEAVGTITSVEALNARTIGLLRSGVLKSAASDAVRAIQARASGAESGGLSIAIEEDRGGLSVAGEGGALSEVEP